MRLLFAAAASLVAAAAASAGVAPRPETLVSVPNGTISGFTQDGPLVAWFVRQPGGRCNTVNVLSLASALRSTLPSQAARNVTCTWQVESRVRLAVDDSSRVLWTLSERAPLEYDYLIGAGPPPADRRERRFQQLAHTNKGAGLWLGGVAGNGSTLAYAVTSVEYVDEAGCLAGTDTCAVEISKQGSGVYRFDGWRPQLVPRTGAAVELAVSDETVAYVPTSALSKQGKPLPGADLPISIVDAKTGLQIASVTPQGTPVAIALAPHILASLERTPLGVRIAWYDAATGQALGSVPVSAATAAELTATDAFVAFRVGRSIRVVDLATGDVRTVATAASTPIGLSLQDSRLAWAENPKHGLARIRALRLAP
ncbi:MAG TPA: hypothetical protein VFA30_05135 [Gaiellaceae bacterium]|nr:hypothetical protein [Gaiellaceae bacterium]